MPTLSSLQLRTNPKMRLAPSMPPVGPVAPTVLPEKLSGVGAASDMSIFMPATKPRGPMAADAVATSPSTSTSTTATVTTGVSSSSPGTRGAHRAMLDGPIDVTLDQIVSTGRMVADVPLSSFTPPLTRADLEGLVARVSVPPNGNGLFQPSLVDRDGKTFLHLDVPKAVVGSLAEAPIMVLMGKPDEMGQTPSPDLVAKGWGATDAARFQLQISSKNVRVDRTLPQLVLAKDARDKTQHTIDDLVEGQAKTASDVLRAPLVHALDDANHALDDANTALVAPRQAAEAKLTTLPALDVLAAMPDAPADLMVSAATAATPADKAQVAQTIASTYASLRAEHPDRADQWLATLEPTFASALTSRTAAKDDVDGAQNALARFDRDAPKRADLDATTSGWLASAKRDLATQSQRVSDLEQGRVKDVGLVATAYDPTMIVA